MLKIRALPTIGERGYHQDPNYYRWSDIELVEEFLDAARGAEKIKSRGRCQARIKNGASWGIQDVMIAAQNLRAELRFCNRKRLNHGVMVDSDYTVVPLATIDDMKKIVRKARRLLLYG